MAKKGKKNVNRYRDSRTGRYVSQSTWKRSHARGGTRYRRSVERLARLPVRKVSRPRRIARKLPRARRIAYLISFSYQPHQKGSKKLIEADLIVGGKPGMTKDAVIKMVEDIAFKEGFTKGKFTWLHDILAATEDEDIRVDPAPKERAPKKIKIRSVKRGGSEIFEDEDDDDV